jgi:hypothetical protein
MTRVIYSSGVVQKFDTKAKAEAIAAKQREQGYSVVEDRDGDFFVDDEADIESATLR